MPDDKKDETLPLPPEVWVVCEQVLRGKYSSDFVCDLRHSAMEHAGHLSEDPDTIKEFGPFRVARYVLADSEPRPPTEPPQKLRGPDLTEEEHAAGGSEYTRGWNECVDHFRAPPSHVEPQVVDEKPLPPFAPLGATWEHFEMAYKQACETSRANDWMQAALIVQQVRRAALSATGDTARIDFLAGITDSSVRRDLFDQKLKAEEAAALERAGQALSVGYERHRQSKDTPTAFRAAVDDAMSGTADGTAKEDTSTPDPEPLV